MASIYDVNRAIAKPNMLGAVQQGYAFGTQQRQMREQEQRQAQLNMLAPDVIAGDPAAYQQAAAIDPVAAQQQQAAGDSQWRRLKGGMDFLKQAVDSGNPQRIAAAEAQVGPYLSRLTGKPWTPGALTADPAAFEAAYARIAMAGQGAAPAQEGKVVGNNLVDPVTGRVIYEGPQVPVNAQLVNVPDGNGGFMQMVFDPRTRQLSDLPVPNAQPAQQPPGNLQPQSAEQLVAQIEASQGPLDPQVRAQIMADVQRNGGRFDSGAVVPPTRAPGPRPGYTPPKPENAPAGYRWAPDGSLAPIPGGPADKPAGGQMVTLSAQEVADLGLPEGTVAQRAPDGKVTVVSKPNIRDAGGGRPLPANVIEGLSKDAEKLTTLTNLRNTFKDDFAGNVVTGGVENTLGQLGGERLGLVSEGQTSWWQEYDRLRNVVRNELFGAALTATEAEAFERADIRPNMDPKIIKKNLAIQSDLIDRALKRKARVWESQGYNPNAVLEASQVTVQPPAQQGAPAAGGIRVLSIRPKGE